MGKQYSKSDANARKRHNPPIDTFDFVSFAREFLKAAKAVRDPKTRKGKSIQYKSPYPAFYLVGHSIELSLKSYLVAKGYSYKTLRSRKKFGHDLELLLQSARDEKLCSAIDHLTSKQLASVVALNRFYFKKDLGYLTHPDYKLPDYAFVFATAKTLLEGVNSQLIKGSRD